MFSPQFHTRKFTKRCLTLAAYLIPCIAMSSMLSGNASAQAAYWQVSGRIEDPNGCPFAFHPLRVRSRLASNFGIGLGDDTLMIENWWSAPWGSPAGVFWTDENGFFRVTKSLPFSSPLKTRDISIQLQGSFYQWIRVAVFDDININDRTSVNGNIWQFDLGTFQTGAVRADPTNCPPAEDPLDNIRYDPDHATRGIANDSEADEDRCEGDEDRCEDGEVRCVDGEVRCDNGEVRCEDGESTPHEIPYGFVGNIDFEIVNTLVVNRPSQDPNRGITTSYVTIRNNGTTPYDKNISTAILTLTLPHLSAKRINSWNKTVPSLAPGEQKQIVMYNGNFQTDQPKHSPFNAYKIIYQVDSTAMVFESDETNNCHTGSYTPATETYEE